MTRRHRRSRANRRGVGHAVRTKGRSFPVPQVKMKSTATRAMLAQPKGLRKLVGPKSWKFVPMSPPNPPRLGSGKGSVVLSGIGAQTQRAPGPCIV
jgi:hypothetical protein